MACSAFFVRPGSLCGRGSRLHLICSCFIIRRLLSFPFAGPLKLPINLHPAPKFPILFQHSAFSSRRSFPYRFIPFCSPRAPVYFLIPRLLAVCSRPHPHFLLSICRSLAPPIFKMASESAMASIIAQLDRVMGALDKQVGQLNWSSCCAADEAL